MWNTPEAYQIHLNTLLFSFNLQGPSTWTHGLSCGRVPHCVGRWNHHGCGSSSGLNDDLYWAVLGGASGSWGVITQVTIKPRKDADYFSVYGTTSFLFEEEGAVGLYRRFAEIANTYPDDTRWTIVINSFNLADVRVMSVETAWVAPLEEAGDYDPALFESVLGACVGCIPLISAPPVVEPLSFSLRFKYVRKPCHIDWNLERAVLGRPTHIISFPDCS